MLVRADAASGNNAVQVRRMPQVLAPGVQEREEADVRAEVSVIAGDGEQCWRAGVEPDVVDRLLVQIAGVKFEYDSACGIKVT